MTTKKKTVRTDKQRHQDAGHKIAELIAEVAEARDHAIARSMELADALARIGRLENHIRDLRSLMNDQWATIDLLRRMLAGSETVMRGVTARQAARQGIMSESMEILPNSPKNSDEAGVSYGPKDSEDHLRDGRLPMGKPKCL